MALARRELVAGGGCAALRQFVYIAWNGWREPAHGRHRAVVCAHGFGSKRNNLFRNLICRRSTHIRKNYVHNRCDNILQSWSTGATASSRGDNTPANDVFDNLAVTAIKGAVRRSWRYEKIRHGQLGCLRQVKEQGNVCRVNMAMFLEKIVLYWCKPHIHHMRGRHI